MDGTIFDQLARDASQVRNRRGALAVMLGGVAAAVTAGTDIASAKRGKKKKRCRKLTQGCSSKKKCCNGLVCTGGACACPAGPVAAGGSCVPQAPGGCTSDSECGAGQV